MAGFIFGGDTGIESPQELAKKRELVRALQTRAVSANPRTFGEGLTAIGQAIAGRMSDKSIGKREEVERERVSGAFNDITAQLMGGGYGANVSSRSFTPQPVVTPQVSTTELANVPQQIGNDAMAALGKPQNGLPASIIKTESGGNWRALNSEGYGGRGQFGKERLADAARAGVVPPGMTGADYSRAPQEVQLAVENWHKNDILGDLGQYVGLDVDGPGPIPPLTENSILAVAHLGGTGGAKKFIETGGRYNPSDSNGTSLSDYAITHAGGSAGSGGQGINPQLIAQLSELASNPYLPEGQRAIVQQLMGNQMNAMDPMRQLEMERARLEIEAMRNPQPDQSASSQKYQELIALGVDPETAQSMAYSSGPTVNLNTGSGDPQWGDAPKDHVWLRDENNEVILEPDPSGRGVRPVSVPVAGGPEDATNESENAAMRAQDGISLIDSIINDPALPGITGMVQGRMPPMTQAGTDLNVKIQQLQGQAFLQAFESLKGGGQITEIEGQKAENAMARLQRAQSTEAYLEALNELKSILQRAVERAPQGALPPTTSAPAAPAPNPAPVEPAPSLFLERPEVAQAAEAQGVSVEELWQKMTPEQRAAWLN